MGLEPTLALAKKQWGTATSKAVRYVTTTGDDANDGLTWGTAKATISGAQDSLPFASDGVHRAGRIKVGPGDFTVSSTGRLASLTFTSGNATVPDANASASDVGAYVAAAPLGPTSGWLAKIVSVSAGVSFTLDAAPTSSGTYPAIITTPAIDWQAGVSIEGSGGYVVPPGSADLGAANGPDTVTRILDTGTGVTVWAATDSISSAPFPIRDIAVHGQNTTIFGLYMHNGQWFTGAYRCSFSYHGTAGVAASFNMNSDQFVECLITGNGTAGATTVSGGMIVGAIATTSSSSIILDTCFFQHNYGWGLIGGPVLAAAPAAAGAVSLRDTQFNNTKATSATDSGWGAYVKSYQPSGLWSTVVGGWFETSDTGDLRVAGPVACIGVVAKSSVPYSVELRGDGAMFLGCHLEGTSHAIHDSLHQCSWAGCYTTSSKFLQTMSGTASVIAAGPGASQSNPVVPAKSLSYGTAISVDASQARSFTINATNGTAFTVSNPTNAVAGQLIELTISNTSGGALGTVTWGTAYKLAAWASPATGYSRSIRFRYDGTNWIEVSRTPADVPN